MSIEDELGDEPMDALPDASEGDLLLIEGVTKHFEDTFGPIETTFHEKTSDFVHVDVHQIELAEGEDARTYFTTGLAERPMNVPSEVPDPDEYRYAELVLHLPTEWASDWGALQKHENWWPLACLINLARLPHQHESWLWGGHTINNESPYANDVGFTAAIICPSYLLPEDSETVSLPDGRMIVLLTVAFIYPEELAFCMENGSEAFFDRVQESGLSPFEFLVVNKNRPNVCATQ